MVVDHWRIVETKQCFNVLQRECPFKQKLMSSFLKKIINYKKLEIYTYA